MDADPDAEIRLSIGGLDFVLSGGGRTLRHDVTPSYLPFLVSPPGREAAEPVHVRFEVSSVPSFVGQTIFSSEATWSILARDGERAFAFREPGSPDPTYLALFRPGSREVNVFCSPRMVEPGETGDVLRSPFRYPLDQILTMYFLAGQGFVLHSAGLVFGGGGLVFPGVSGAGKSTFAGLAASRPGWEPLSDDRTILRLQDGRPTVHGTPWPGEGRIAENRCAPLAGILFLEKGPGNEVRPITQSECLSRLFPVISVPWFDREVLPQALSVCETIARSVPAAVLGFRPEEGAAEAVENLIAAGL